MEGNFLEYAASKLGIDVGFGKMILIYPAKTDLTAANLTAASINTGIITGAIIGVIKGWHTIAGAPVAEINVERTATAEMHLIRPEIGADTLTFESNMVNAEVLADLVKAGSMNCVLIDDQGNAFGDYSATAGSISTMLLNFSNKATSAVQRDNVTEKTIALTVRYLVKDLSVMIARIETELIESKSLLVGQLSSVDGFGTTGRAFSLLLIEKSTGISPQTAITSMSANIRGTEAIFDTSSYDIATGILQIQLTGTGLQQITPETIFITLSADGFYMKETKFVITPS